MKTKKILFLSFFLCIAAFMMAQSSVNKHSAKQKTYFVKIETDYGSMKVQLFNETPRHRDNFLELVRKGTYDGLLFHRVIRNFMIQGGDPDSKNAKPNQPLGAGNLGYTVPAEFNASLFHRKGALAAARQGDQVNPKKASSASQFYIVQGNVWNESNLQMMERQMGKKFSDQQRRVYTTVGGTPHLDGEYTVFGQVVEGLEVIDKIAAVQCGPGDRPLKDIKMKITIIENDK